MTRKKSLKRLFRYLYLKMVREKGSPDYIARGWAIGMFIGCTMPMSCQLIVSIPLSFPLRGSKIGATLGTFITNPVTIFFIYPVQCFIGNKLIGGSLSYEETSRAINSIITDQSWRAIAALGRDLMFSFFAGGLLLAAVSTPITYFGVRAAVRHFRAFRAKMVARRSARKHRA